MTDQDIELLEKQDFLGELRFSGNKYFENFLNNIGHSLKFQRITDEQWAKIGPAALESPETQLTDEEREEAEKDYGRELDIYLYFLQVRGELEEEVTKEHIHQDLVTRFEQKFFNRFSKVEEPELVAA